MALQSFTVTIVSKSDSPFNIIENAPIEIRERLANGTSGGLSLIFSDSAGLNPITQSGATANSLGQFSFFAAAADYNAVFDNNGTPVTIAVDVGVTGGVLNARFDRLNPDTLAIAIADSTLELDDIVHTKNSLVSLPGGSGFFEVVLLSSTAGGAATGLREFASTGGQVPALALVLQLENGMYTGRQIGTGSDTVVRYFNKDDIPIFNLSDGSNSSQSHVFFLPLDIRRDSHSFIVSPGTIGGTCDHLFRRGLTNPDPAGNRYAFNFTESPDSGVTPDVWNITFATTDAGSPSFDAFIECINGTSPELNFPAIAPNFRQGFSVKKRSGGTFEYQQLPGDTENEIKDKTSGNQLALVDKSGFRFGGIKHTNLTDLPIRTDANQFGIAFSDSGLTLPNTTKIYSMTTGTFQAVIIEMLVAFTASGGGASFRKTTWHYDGTTLTAIDVIDTLPAQVTADIVVNGTDLELQTDYTGGLGGGFSMSVMLHYCTAGR